MVSEISILIPVYNRNVTALVESVLAQATTLSISFEIRVYDDGSAPETLTHNQALENLPHVLYRQLPENVGRSQIRYLLAQEARYDTLLFLDNDVLPQYPDFLSRYLQQFNGHVTVGGIAYQGKAPVGTELRWKYGKAREEAKAVRRQKTPYQRVFSSNLMVERHLFLKLFPRQEVRGYGHEDTFFAHRLQQNLIPVQHIDNPVWHLGLEPAQLFLLKTNEAILNLIRLNRQGQLGEESRLFKLYLRLKKWKADAYLKENSSWLLPMIKRNLVSRSPSLHLFDLYRLLLLDRYLRK
jgi:glycosyltransferase involved in cell wall biosynthesis